MGISKFIEKYSNILNKDNNNELYKDINDLIKEEIRCIENNISFSLSEINTICDSIISNEENEYMEFIYQIYHKLSFDICFLEENIINRFSRSLDELYHDSLYRYKDYGFPESFKEFINNDSYIIKLIGGYKNVAK